MRKIKTMVSSILVFLSCLQQSFRKIKDFGSPPEFHGRRRKRAGSSPVQDGSGGNAEREVDRHFDRLATTKGKTAQAPTCVFEHVSGGQVWLSGLPTVSTMQHWPAATIQVQCFAESLSQKGGIQLPGTQLLVVAPADRATRDAGWRTAWPRIRQTVHAGENVVIHCLSGRHRAAGIAVLVRSLLSGDPIPDSDRVISSLRDIQRHVGEWIHQSCRTSYVGPVLPPVKGYMATGRSQVHLMVEGPSSLCSHKQSSAKAADRLSSPMVTTSMLEAMAWGRPLCESCWVKAPSAYSRNCVSCETMIFRAGSQPISAVLGGGCRLFWGGPQGVGVLFKMPFYMQSTAFPL